MSKKLNKDIQKAWFQYQDLFDRHMALLRAIGESTDLEALKSQFAAVIDYALNEWETPQTRFEMGGYDDFDLGLDDDDEFGF